MNATIAEALGTALLIIFGNGVVANVVLARTKGNNAGWMAINVGWGLAVFVAAFCTAAASGAHLNPALTIALAAAGKLEAAKIVPYILAQMVGAIIGAVIVFIFYRDHFAATTDADAKLACFSTGPAIRSPLSNLISEVIGTFCLVLPILLMADASVKMPGNVEAPIGLGSLGLVPVGLLVFAIGLSLGGTTGYAINPARDLGPRIAHFLLPIPGKRDSDWAYAWIPVVGPIVGGLLAVGLHKAIA